MKQFFVPYSGKRPAPLVINGHRLLILSKEREIFEDDLEKFGADRLKAVEGGGSQVEESRMIEKLSRAAAAGVVIAPANIALEDLVKNLEHELPWLQ